MKSKNSFILFQQIKAIEAYYKGDLSKEQKYIESALQSMIEVDDYISENTSFINSFIGIYWFCGAQIKHYLQKNMMNLSVCRILIL